MRYDDYSYFLMVMLLVAAVSGVSSCSKENGGDTPAEEAAVAPVQPTEAGNAEREPGVSAEWIKTYFGEQVVRKDGTNESTETLAGKKIGLYFSAHWCPPCRAFSPVLVKTYNEIRDKGNEFEIILVSSDRNGDDMFGYMREVDMPWVAIPFGSPLRAKLSEQYGVQGIPTFVILDEGGRTVTKDGRGDVASKGAAAFDDW